MIKTLNEKAFKDLLKFIDNYKCRHEEFYHDGEEWFKGDEKCHLAWEWEDCNKVHKGKNFAFRSLDRAVFILGGQCDSYFRKIT